MLVNSFGYFGYSHIHLVENYAHRIEIWFSGFHYVTVDSCISKGEYISLRVFWIKMKDKFDQGGALGLFPSMIFNLLFYSNARGDGF